MEISFHINCTLFQRTSKTLGERYQKREWIFTYPMNITTPTFAISSCRICHVFVTNSFCSLVKGGLSTVGLISSIALPCTSILQPSGLLSPLLYVLDFLLAVLSWEVWLPMVLVWYSLPRESAPCQKSGRVSVSCVYFEVRRVSFSATC